MGESYQRVHRVGTMTLGVGLIIFGGLFLLKIFFPVIDFLMIYRLWPSILILLGIEVLLSCRKSNIIYDKWGIVILVCLVSFALIMGWMDSAYVNYFM